MNSLRGRLRRLAGSAAAMAALVAAVAVAASIAVAAVLAAEQRGAARQQLQRRTGSVAEAVSGEAVRYVDALQIVAAGLGAVDVLTASSFGEVTQPLTSIRLAGATSVVFIVPTADTQIADVQQLWRGRGASGLTLKPDGSGREHMFSVFSRPLDGVTTRRAGIDASQSGPATQALNEARRSGRVALSDPYQLIIDQKVPAALRQLSFSMTAPVYGPPDRAGHRPFRGWALMGLRGRDFIAGTLDRVTQDLVDVTLCAPRADGTYPVVTVHRAATPGRRDLSADSEVTVANRVWRLQVRADSAQLPGGTTGTPAVVLAAGILLSLLLAGLVWVLCTGRARAQARVAAATAELTTAEAAAREQADLLTAIMDSISDGVAVVDTHGAFLLHNPAGKTILGLTEDVDGPDNWQQHYGVFRPDGRTPYPTGELPLVRALAGQDADQIELVIRNRAHPHGISLTVSARPLRTAGGQVGAVAVFHDVTARNSAAAELAVTAEALRTELRAHAAAETDLRAARDALADQRAYLAQVLDAIDVAVITCDVDGTIVHANRTARTVLHAGAPGETIASAYPHFGLTDPDGTPIPLTDAPLIRALHGEHLDRLEAAAPARDGAQRALLLHSRPLRDSAGVLIGAVAAAADVTALRDREADLRAFAGVAAHDLKAPLTVIAGFAEFLHDDLPADTSPQAHDDVDRILAGVSRMQQLIDDLLAYAAARDATLNLQPVDLQGLVAEIVTHRTAHLRHNSNAGGRPALFPDIYTGPLPVVHADPAMIRQLLDNLIGNALKYTWPGQPARIDISAHQRTGDTHTGIVIADRGIGIPDTEKPHVFTSFHRAANHGNRPGTGLGLAICHRIAERHHGTITAGDNPGGGTRILLTLPTSKAQPPPNPEPRATADQPTHRTPTT